MYLVNSLSLLIFPYTNKETPYFTIVVGLLLLVYFVYQRNYFLRLFSSTMVHLQRSYILHLRTRQNVSKGIDEGLDGVGRVDTFHRLVCVGGAGGAGGAGGGGRRVHIILKPFARGDVLYPTCTVHP